MEFGLEGKVAMVAAASKGIGLAIAQELAREGCRISICARNEEVLEAAASMISEDARTYVVDVSDREDLEWWFDQTKADLGPVDLLVTNTGGPPAGPLASLTDEQWQLGFDSTLMNVVRMVQLAKADMIERGWGRIVHLTSLVAVQPSDLLPISSTLRAGLQALTRTQSNELARYGITVNAVLPGHTMTDRQRHLAKIRSERDGISEADALSSQAEEVPVGRIADPEEIAAAVAFLCSTRASYISGTSLLVDGGLTKGY
ncbi:MAG: SDR family oxidoreductase [Fimbriimonas sp.]